MSDRLPAYKIFGVMELFERDMPTLAEGIAEPLTRETVEFLRWAVCQNMTNVPLSAN